MESKELVNRENAPDEAQNDQAQAPSAQDNQQTEKVTAGGCHAAPCSALSAELMGAVAEKISEISKNSKAVCYNYLKSFLVTGQEPRFSGTLPIYLKLNDKVRRMRDSLRGAYLSHLQYTGQHPKLPSYQECI